MMIDTFLMVFGAVVVALDVGLFVVSAILLILIDLEEDEQDYG